ncbi:MAG: SPOR domain-containing protein [Hyphomicrobium sp.]|uniref:SPOR domain-containing protein n=1 Tax=Hyphomicrobium sp. TaxID=82 RepID=UPI0039E495F6
MSSQNAFPGPNTGRPLARPATPAGNSQPSWVNPQAQPIGRQQQPNGWPAQQQPQQPQQPAQGYPPNFQQPGYGGHAPEPQQPAYGQWSELQPGNRGGYPQQGSAPQADPYAPQFEPYVPPSRPNFQQPQAAPDFGAQQPAQQWPGRPTDPRGYDAGGYGAQPYPAAPQQAHPASTFGQQQYHESELSAADWAGPHDGFGQDPYQQHQHADPHLGFGQAEGGELEPVYNDEEYEDYEDEEDAPRGRRPLMIVAALIGAIVIGGGMAYGYKKFAAGGVRDGDPPVVKSDDFAAKTKPADAGGKQFPYSDTKIMGRLGDGTSSASAEEANGSSAGTSDNNASQDGDGPRKVSTLVVGRDGSIMSQATPTEDQSQTPPAQGGTAVPGTSLVDVFGQQGGGSQQPAPPAASAPPPTQTASIDASAPAKKAKPVKITTINAPDSADDTPAPPKKKLKKVARAEPTVETDATADAPPVTTHTGTGFVAVLASVPHSETSRIDALKRFADMQQKYSTALAGKTPDIASANLAKGVYDRLVVGPPGSREEASNVCAQLKAQGYHSCWVTSY